MDVIGYSAGRPDADASGFFGGGQVGYNWQDDIYVYGLEGDFQFSDIKGSDNKFSCYENACGRDDKIDYRAGEGTRAKQNLKWFSTIRGRAGVSPNESLLFYATAGLAFGKVKNGADVYVGSEVTEGAATASTYTGFPASSSKTKVGWTAGFGSELKITENVSFKVEYLYLDLGKKTIRGDYFAELCSNSDCESITDPDFNAKYKFKNQFHTVKAGLNWGF